MQGDWGEMVLETILENSGLRKDEEFFIQENTKDENGKNFRPDMTDRALPPVIVLLSDGQPTDDYKKSLDKLLHLPWGKKAVRIAISIGQDADDDVLQQFTGNRELVLQANNPQALVKMIKWASTAASLVSAPASRPKEMDVVPAGNNTPSATNAPLVLDMNNIPDPGSIGANDVW